MKFNWGNGILMFIILFLSSSIVFMIFALRQNNDLVENDYYNKGANYTHQMEINKQSTGFEDSIHISSEEKYIVIRRNRGLTKISSDMNIYFFCPSDKAKDYTIFLPAQSDSLKVDKSKLAHGRYKVKISWIGNSNEYMVEKNIFIQ
jgi:hypothetical protein